MSAVKKEYESESDSEESSQNTDEDEKSSEDGSSDQSNHNEIITDTQEKGTKQGSAVTEHHTVTFVCNTLSDYASKEAGELSFEKGEMLTIVDISRKDGWWKAKNSEGIQGLVPSTFLKVPDHVNALLSETQESKDSKEIHFWSNLRSSLRKARAYNTAIRTFGSIGLPLGFRDSYLSTKLKEEKDYSAEAFLTPKLNDSGLSFEDMQWETSHINDTKISLQMKPITTVLQKVIQLVALRQIIPPPSGYEVTSRHVHMCLHDGNDIQSNIHTTQASWDEKNPKIWMFATKIPNHGSSLEEGQIFIRSNKLHATLGILFELCISYKKKDSSEIEEISCGWAFMRLLNDSGVPVKSRTKILKVHNSVPFKNNLDASSSLSSLQKLMNRSKQPRMVITISSPKRSSSQQICYLPTTLIGSVSNIPLIALYRKVISGDLLQRTSFDSAELIQSPFLANFPQMFNEPDLTDFFRTSWAEKLKKDKTNMRTEEKKLNAFSNLFMETAFLIMNSCSLPSYCLGNLTHEQERKVKLNKVKSILNSKESGILALSKELEFKPISVKLLSTYLV